MLRDREGDKDPKRRRERNIAKTMEINVKMVSDIRIQFHNKKKINKKEEFQ